MSLIEAGLLALRQTRQSKTIRDVSWFRPRRFGPPVSWLGPDRFTIREGWLSGTEFALQYEQDETRFLVHLCEQARQVGCCAFDLTGEDAEVVIWNVMVDAQMRGQGLAAIMIATGLRRVLEDRTAAGLALRMVRLLKSGGGTAEVQNIGIGVIANRLGFTPENDLRSVFRDGNVLRVEGIATEPDRPAGFRVSLHDYPHVMVALVLNPVTGRPYRAGHPICSALPTPDQLFNWANCGMLAVGNCNYRLRQSGIPAFVNHLARNQYEARELVRRIRAMN
jgi:hypothetical protein